MLTYVLIAIDQALQSHVQQKIEQIAGDFLDKVSVVYGEYDLLVKLKTKNPEQVNVTLREIKLVDGVQYFKTYVVSVPTREWDVIPKEKIIQHH